MNVPISSPSTSYPKTPRTGNALLAKSRRSAPQPILKNASGRPRQAFALTLLLFSFIITTLGIIYASCVVLPHSNQSSTSANSRIPKRQYDIGSDTDSANNSTLDPQTVMEQTRFTTHSAMASLGFYTLTTPFVTFIHSSIELLIVCVRPETMNLSASRRSRLSRALPIVSLCISIMLFLGWIPTALIWTNCEISEFDEQAVGKLCPVQIQGHRMGGIDELSIAKVVFAGLTALVYIAFATHTILALRQRSGRNRPRQRARFTTDDESDTESEVIVVELDHSTAKDLR